MVDQSFRDRQPLHNHWRLILAEGLLLLLAGLAAILLPSAAGLVATIVLGWLLIFTGLLGLFTSWVMRRAPGFWWSLLSAVIALAVGASLLFWPLSGLISLTLLLSVFLFADGITTILMALDQRAWRAQSWGWMLANGLLDLLLAGAIAFFLPATALWVIGTVIGIDFVFGGIGLAALALAARRAAPAA